MVPACGPLTDHTPKPLLQVGGKPLIVWHIENLQRGGFKDIIINIAWLGNQIPEALGDGSQFGVNLHYSDEQNEGALETAGGIIKALPLLGDSPFLVVNGDVWCNHQYSNTNPLRDNELAYLFLVNNPEHNPTGDFSIYNKLVKDGGKNALTFSGIGYYHPELFSKLPYGKQGTRAFATSGNEHSTSLWRTLFSGILLSTTLLFACGGSSSNSDESTSAAPEVESSELSAAEIEGLLFMREEEELARDLYLDIYAAKGNPTEYFQEHFRQC
ncbi:N-acetylmuramate alpha-1-phosphate uridylyltransferase [Nymphon striatum]|nr:N-acetylmuramate alpha-1-phosphate uridylyltransferase [Nymphon striatum]